MEEQQEQLNKTMVQVQQDKQYLSDNVRLLLHRMERFSEGDLTVSLDVEKDDDIGKLFRGFNQVVENIRTILVKVESVVEATTNHAQDIENATNQLVVASKKQWLQSDEVNVSLETMNATISTSAQQANDTARFADSNKTIAQEGGSTVTLAVRNTKDLVKIVAGSSQSVLKLTCFKSEDR
jgi:methyl-accepting chemotaxis protein